MTPPGELPVSVRARRKITRRLMPFLFLLYIVAYLDRVNVAFAALEMSRDLGFSDRVVGLGAGIFFIGYFLLEVPGALIVERWGARRWMARIMITWGLVTILTAFVRSAGEFYTVRFLLGAAEAGFFPGMIVYLTHWFRSEDRAKAVAMFMSALAVSNVIGSPVAGLLLTVRWYGLDGWRWLFVLEGIPAILLGVVTLVYLTDRPQQAGRWLDADERDWIIGELEREQQARLAVRSYNVWEAFRHRDVVLMTAGYFFAVTGFYGFTIWLPTILQRSSGLPTLTVTLLVAIPYAAGLAAMLANGWHSDKTGERRLHTALPLFLGGGAFLVAVISGGKLWLAVLMFAVAGACLHAFLPTFWAMPTMLLSKSAAAASIGLINSIGNLGGFAGPYVVGYLRERSGSFTPGLVYLLSSVFLAAILLRMVRIRPGAGGGSPPHEPRAAIY